MDRFVQIQNTLRQHRRARVLRLAVAVSTVATVGVACTTDKASTSSAPGSTSTVPTTAAGTSASGTPIRIGFTNAETGATAIPAVTVGARMAVDHINKHANGVNGHPIELVVCATDGTPESSAACANKLVAEKVVATIDGTDLGTDAKVPILSDAGIATLGTSTLGTAQAVNQNAFFFAPAATSFPRAEVDLAAEVGATHITMMFPDVPQVAVLSDLIAAQAKLDGITADVIKFDPAAPDFDAALAAAMSNGSDAIATIATDDWCTGIIRSARSANFKGSIIVGSCMEFTNSIGAADTEGIYTLNAIWGPSSVTYAPEAAVNVIDGYSAAMSAAGKGSEVVGLSWLGYAPVIQVAEFLRTIDGDFTAASVLKAAHAMSNVTNALGESITCNPRPYTGFSGCTKGWLRFQQQRDGSAKPLSDDFVKPKS